MSTAHIMEILVLQILFCYYIVNCFYVTFTICV